MKNSLRILAVVLAAVLLMSSTAFAAEAEGDSIIAPVDGSNTTAAFQAGYEKLDVTYQNENIVAGGLYIIFVVLADGDGKYIPTESSVLYINQVAAADDGIVIFNDVYPSKIANSAIMISGTGLTGLETVAKIEIPYGDVDGDGKIAISDAILILQHVADVKSLTGTELLAADVDGVEGIGISDAIRILRVVSGVIRGI